VSSIARDGAAPAAAIEIEAYGKSDIGQVRDGNEDAFAIGDLDQGELWDGVGPARGAGARGHVLVVCDGMGGASGGEVAAELAARTLWRELRASQDTDQPAVFARLLRRAVRAANARVFDESRRELALRGMGTTLSAAGVCGGHLVIAQVGDSRVYVLRAGVLVQVTRDQSLVQALVGAGQLTADEARTSSMASAILQALGVGPDVEASLSLVELRRGDRILLCSDGLHNQLGDLAISAILGTSATVKVAADTLVAAAHAAGGADNITALVASISGAGVAAPASEEDLPRFIEFDPDEEGARALHSTSYVVRRLAARVGIGDDPGPPVVPATGQHLALRHNTTGPTAAIADLAGPARARLGSGAERARWWAAVIALTVAAAAAGWWLAAR
jgi:serine/threonine protein phosphatase PrpC